MKIQRFEDLIAWQKARLLTKAIYLVHRKPAFERQYELKSQMQRSAISVMANVAEGFERHRMGEFYQFLSVSKASCAELRSQIYVSLDIGFVTKNEAEELLSLAEEVARIVGGLRAAVQMRKLTARESTRAYGTEQEGIELGPEHIVAVGSALSTQHPGL